MLDKDGTLCSAHLESDTYTTNFFSLLWNLRISFVDNIIASSAPFPSIVAPVSTEEAIYVVKKDYLHTAIVYITTGCGTNYNTIV